MRWYADNSELSGVRSTQIPDILLFGGISVPPESDILLRTEIEQIKAKYGNARAPIKWNFKDLKSLYEKQKKRTLYEKLLKDSKEWRTEIFGSIKDIDFTVIIAIVQSHSVDKKIIREVKATLTGFVFSNSLMRVALHAKKVKPERYQIVLAWPDKGDPDPFDSEYASAYNFGKTKGGHVSYHSGPLKDLGFIDSTVYTNMNHSTLLQLADLIVGATREFIECAIGKKHDAFGQNLTRLIARRFLGYPEDIFGRGISVASGDAEFKVKIKEYIKRKLK